MGLVQEAMGPTLYPVLEGWAEYNENNLPRGHVFLSSSVEHLSWVAQKADSVLDGVEKLLYVVALVGLEVIGVIGSAIKGGYDVLGEVFGTRSMEAVAAKGYEVLCQTGETLDMFLYTVVKVILVYTDDQDFNDLTRRQIDFNIAEKLEAAHYLHIGSDGMECKDKVNTFPGMDREEAIRVLTQGKSLQHEVIGIGTFSKEETCRAIKLVSGELSVEQQQELAKLADPTTELSTLDALRVQCRDEGVLERIERALRLGINRIQLDTQTVWILLDFIEDPVRAQLLEKVEVFDIREVKDGCLGDKEATRRCFQALYPIHKALARLSIRHPWDNLFFLSKRNNELIDTEGVTLIDRVYTYRNGGILDGPQKAKLESVLRESMNHTVLTRSDLLRTKSQRAGAGICEAVKPVQEWLTTLLRPWLFDANTMQHTFHKNIIEMLGPKAMPEVIYEWSEGINVSRLKLDSKCCALHFKTPENFLDFCNSCKERGAEAPVLPITDLIFDYTQEADAVKEIRQHLTLEKVHFHCNNVDALSVADFDDLGLYSLQIKEDVGGTHLVMLSEMPARDLVEVVSFFENSKKRVVSRLSPKAYQSLSIQEVEAMIYTPTTRAIPLTFDMFFNRLQGNKKGPKQEVVAGLESLLNCRRMARFNNKKIQRLVAKLKSWEENKDDAELLRQAIDALFKAWQHIAPDQQPLLKRVLQDCERVAHSNRLREAGNMSFNQVVQLFESNKGFKHDLNDLLSGIVDFQDREKFPTFESKLEVVLADWQPSQIQAITDKSPLGVELTKPMVKILRLFSYQVHAFNVRSKSLAATFDSNAFTRAVKAFSMPVIVPSNYLVTPEVIAVVNQTGAPLFVHLSLDTLRVNIEALKGITRKARVVLMPDTHVDFTYWFHAFDPNPKRKTLPHIAKEATEIKTTLQELQKRGVQLKWFIPKTPYGSDVKAANHLSLVPEGDDDGGSRASSRSNSRSSSFEEIVLPSDLVDVAENDTGAGGNGTDTDGKGDLNVALDGASQHIRALFHYFTSTTQSDETVKTRVPRKAKEPGKTREARKAMSFSLGEEAKIKHAELNRMR